MTVEVSASGAARQDARVRTLKTRIRERAVRHFRDLGLPEAEVEVSVVLTDDATMSALNEAWREVNGPTDVLSFPLWEPEQIEAMPPQALGSLGDVIISLEYAERTLASGDHRRRVAEALGHEDPEALAWGLDDEVLFLFLHGLLHLLGHDHGEPREEARMRAEERRLWSGAR